MKIYLSKLVKFSNSMFNWKNEIPNFMDLLKKIMFFPYFLKFYFKKIVSDIKTYSKNIIKLDSIFVFSANFFPTKRHLFYWLCLSRYIYSMNTRLKIRCIVAPSYECGTQNSNLNGSLEVHASQSETNVPAKTDNNPQQLVPRIGMILWN